jgi:hypothetical protein
VVLYTSCKSIALGELLKYLGQVPHQTQRIRISGNKVRALVAVFKSSPETAKVQPDLKAQLFHTPGDLGWGLASLK